MAYQWIKCSLNLHLFYHFLEKYILTSMNLYYKINVVSFQGQTPWTPLGAYSAPQLDAVPPPSENSGYVIADTLSKNLGENPEYSLGHEKNFRFYNTFTLCQNVLFYCL